jgi:hypothetical protein
MESGSAHGCGPAADRAGPRGVPPPASEGRGGWSGRCLSAFPPEAQPGCSSSGARIRAASAGGQPLDEVDQGVEVDAGATGEILGERGGEAGGEEPAAPPGDDPERLGGRSFLDGLDFGLHTS